MIDFDIDIELKTPYLDLLESLIQQSHALKTIHNPKTWCLSALTYALHLNDCLVLFQDLKDRWCKELPFAEAWDVDFRQWKSDIWSAVNDTSSKTHEKWKSLCDTDYKQFIELSNKVADGEISLEPLLAFIDGKETCFSKIIVDAGEQLSRLFGSVEDMVYHSKPELYQTFYDECVDAYNKLHKYDAHIINTKSAGAQTYSAWAASKTAKKLPSAIQSHIANLVSEMNKYKSWNELWEDNYDAESGEIDTEGIARYIFINRKSILISKNPTYRQRFEKLFYTVGMLEFLQEKLSEIKINEETENTQELYKSTNSIFRDKLGEKKINFSKLITFIKENAVETISLKYEWFAVYLFAIKKNLLQDKTLEAFEKQMNKKEWFGWVSERKRCSADSIGDYSFLVNVPEGLLYDCEIPNRKATDKGRNGIMRIYNNLINEYREDAILK